MDGNHQGRSSFKSLLLPVVGVAGLGPLDLLLGGASSRLALVLVLEHLIRVAVEEQVDLHVPRHAARDRAAHEQHLTGEQPVHHTDGVAATVVARDRDVDVLQRRVRHDQHTRLNLSTARWPNWRTEHAITSCGFSIATIIRAARISFSHVACRLITFTPSFVRVYTYFFMPFVTFFVPRWTCDASMRCVSASVACSTFEPDGTPM